MRIGFFGGSFDPPHRGHLAVATAAADAFRLDKVLFAPTGRQPLKSAGAEAPFADRLAMTELLCALSPESGVLAATRFEASSLDAPLPNAAPNYTVDTLTRLQAQSAPANTLPDTLFVIVGADSFLDLPRWRNPDRLLDLAEWIVVSRPGFDLTQLDALGLTPDQHARVHLLHTLADTTSATMVRDYLRQPASLNTSSLDPAPDPGNPLLPPAVLAYIRSHNLYQASTG